MISSDTEQSPWLTVGVAIDPGLSRRKAPNQDSVLIYSEYCENPAWLDAKGRLFVVADGMGGALGGKEASEMAVHILIDSYYEDSDLAIESSLERAIQEANKRINERGQTNSSLRGLGTTIVAAVIRGQDLVVANVGDSRAYLLRRGMLRQLSLDHTSVQEHVRSGLLSPEEAATHPRRHILSRNLGARPRARPDFATETLVEGDTLLLCSDGLWGPVGDEAITTLLQRLRGQAAVDALVARANEQGGPDNISAIVVHIGVPPDHVSADPELLSALLLNETEPSHSTHATVVATAKSPVRERKRKGKGRWIAALGTGVGLVLLVLLALNNQVFFTRDRSLASAISIVLEQTVIPQAGQLAQASTVAVATQETTPTLPVVQSTELPATAPHEVKVFTPTAPPQITPTRIATTISTSTIIEALAFTPDGEILVAASLDAKVKLWRVRDGSLLAEEARGDSFATSIEIAPNGQWLAVGSPDGAITLWPLEHSGEDNGETPTPRGVPTEESAASPASDLEDFSRTAQALPPSATSTPTRLQRHTQPVDHLAFTADGRTLAAAARDGTVFLWQLHDGAFSQELPTMSETITSLVFAPDGKILAVSLDSGTVELLSLTDESLNRSLPTDLDRGGIIAFAPDGRTVAVGAQDGRIEVWRLSDSSHLRTLESGSDAVTDLVFATNGQTLAAASDSGAVQLWNVSTGERIHRFAEHTGAVNSVAFAPDGEMLASASADMTIKFWSINVQTLPSSQDISDETLR
ncbi:MAG: protein phosphatase 2C domain-containing protein [Chloroflexales bacterium]|nr:protein phosphatase 2C domain-containing protein [Chloroflexales bacterium]